MKAHMYLCSAILCFVHILHAQSWHSLGAGLNGPVYEIFIHGDDVYVGGSFHNAGGDPDADFLARWDGCEWHAVAPGLNNIVYAIAIVEERIYVSGNFVDASGIPEIDGIAFWDGVQWNPLGSGLDYYVSDMEVIGEDLYVGGGFNIAGGEVSCVIARWDGSEWHDLGSGGTTCAYDFAFVTDLATDGVNLYVAGSFWNMAGIESADRVARWDGNEWHSLGEGISPNTLWSDHLTLTVANNNVYVAGTFTNAGGNEAADYLVVWDGNQWEGLVQSPADSTARRPFLFQGDLYCVFGNEIRRWNEQSGNWTTMTSIDGLSIVASNAENIYVGGSFNEIGGQSFSKIARWGEEQDCTTSLEKNQSSDKLFTLTIEPNPASEKLSINLDEIHTEELAVLITDIRGRIVINTKSTAREIDISSLYPGVYFITIPHGIQTWRGKFVKM